MYSVDQTFEKLRRPTFDGISGMYKQQTGNPISFMVTGVSHYWSYYSVTSPGFKSFIEQYGWTIEEFLKEANIRDHN